MSVSEAPTMFFEIQYNTKEWKTQIHMNLVATMRLPGN